MSTENSTSQPASPTSSSGTRIRQAILLTLLLAVIGMALYERLYAKPESEKAHALLEEAANARLSSNQRPLRAEEIQELLGQKPDEVVTDENSYQEKYVWTRGLPWQNYFMWVVYTPNKAYRMHCSNEPPDKLAEFEDDTAPNP